MKDFRPCHGLAWRCHGRAMNVFPAALGLAPERIAEIIDLAGRAPSSHNSHPWRFRVTPEVIEVHAETRMPRTDPQAVERRLTCGAVLLNLRLALEHFGVRPSVTLVPRVNEPILVAQVRRRGYANPAAEQRKLFTAITTAGMDPRPFVPIPVSGADRRALAGAVHAEHAWLHIVDRSQRAELARWTAAGSGASAAEVPGKDSDHDPLMVVLCSHTRTRVGDVQAGQALQRMLLTATSLGLVVSSLSPVVAVPESRERLAKLLCDTLYPQALLHIGYGEVSAAQREQPDSAQPGTTSLEDHIHADNVA